MAWFAVELAALFLAVMYGSTVLHELSHCVAVWAQGGRVIMFRPWPQRAGNGKRIDGCMAYSGWVDDRIVSLAPLAKAAVLVPVWIGIGFLHHPLWLLLLGEVVEIAEWVWDYAEREPFSDGGQYRIVSERNNGR